MNHRALLILSTLFPSLALSTPHALAHAGHGLDTHGVGLLHFLTQPSHGGFVPLVAVVFIAAAIVIRQRDHRG